MTGELFERNLKRFERFCPDSVQRVRDATCSHLQFCVTEKGEENLFNTQWTGDPYFYSQKGALEFVKEWYSKQFFLSDEIIVIYGVGLGYHYEVLGELLKNNPKRFLVYIDDDPAVWHRFLETERAERIMKDSQVILADFTYPRFDQWNVFRNKFTWLIDNSTMRKVHCLADNAYATHRPSETSLILTQFNHLIYKASLFLKELALESRFLYTNYFNNIFMIPECDALSPKMNGKLAGLPVIVCGAGPSLDDVMPYLNDYRDKALIFAAGTAMNIVTRKEVRPHFGVSVDPHPIQESRIMSSIAYEIPHVLFPRFCKEATPYLHCPVIFYNLFGGSFCSTWFSEQLGIPKERFTPGISSSTVSLCLAEKFGADFAVLLGMDLAYTGGVRYADGVTRHPTKTPQTPPNPFLAETYNVEAINLDGETITTKTLWLEEASYYKRFENMNPHFEIVNCTDVGLKIEEIPTLPFQEVAKRRLTRPYDIQNWIHSAIQTSADSTITFDRIMEVSEAWITSLKKCQEQLAKEPAQGNRGELVDEPAYKYSLQCIDDLFDRVSQLELNKFELFPENYTEESKAAILVEKEIGRRDFLIPVIEMQLKEITQAIENQRKRRESAHGSTHSFTVPTPSYDGYSYENEVMTLIDADLNIEYRGDFKPDETFSTHYPNGKLEKKMFYLKGELHGPTSFYSEAGTLLARGWFIRGKRSGKNWQYYDNGNLYSLQRYVENNQHGVQEYYYSKGAPKTRLTYNHGHLDGELTLYYPNGKMKKRQHFSKGLLNGPEEFWNDSGLLLIRAEYKNNLPTGTSKVWYANGQLAKEVVFYDDPQNFDMWTWDENGTLLHKKLYLPPSPFGGINKLSEELRKSFSEITAKLENFKKNKES